MVKSMLLGPMSMIFWGGVSGAAMAQARLAVSTDVMQSTNGAPTPPQGAWNACVASYIRDHSAQIQDPDDAAENAFKACQALKITFQSGDKPPLVYVRADDNHAAGKVSFLTENAGSVESGRADPR